MNALLVYECALSEGDDIQSMLTLTILVHIGADVTYTTIQSAIPHYEHAIAEEGHVISMRNLKITFRNSVNGMEQDTAKVVVLCKCALAENEDVVSMFSLTVLLEGGSG